MEGSSVAVRELEAFIREWQTADQAIKNCFLELYRCVSELSGTSLSFTARPGISYSLRPKQVKQQERELFAVIDVIDDTPEGRWLSVCFYEDLITDPEELGERIPGGLPGSDGYCFNVDAADDALTLYLKTRLLEAHGNASR